MLPQGRGHHKSMCQLLSALDVLILEWEENRNTRRKILEAQKRSTTATQLVWEPHQTWFHWWDALQGQINFHLIGGVQISQGGALVCYQGADWTLFIFSHCCRLWFSHFTDQIITYSITLDLLTKIFFQYLIYLVYLVYRYMFRYRYWRYV